MARHGGKNCRVRLTGGLALALLLLAGCSLGGNNRLTLFPEGHPLTDTAKALRDAATEPAPLPRELQKAVLPPYTVEPGDVLLVQPVNLDSPARLPGDQPILPDGTINLGRYGQLVVAGKTVTEIEAEVRALVEAQTKNAGPISVRVVTRVSKVYYVLGEVNAPGAFPLNGRETVLDGILAAGGLNDRASRTDILLVRPTPPHSCRIVLPVCYRDIIQVGDVSTNYQLAPGDRIIVPTRSSSFFDQLFHRKKGECAPCGGPQEPCNLTHCEPPPATHYGPATGAAPAPEKLPPPAASAGTPGVLFSEDAATGTH